MVIDPAVVTPSIESFNRISKVAPFNVTYHLPALYGTSSLHREYNRDTLGIIVLGSATSVNDKNQWQDEIVKILLDGANLVFEGYLANAYETTLTAAEPTADRTITLPNVTGTVITTGNLTVDGSTTGDVLVGEGDSLAYAIVFGS